jgi:hypothetical protein
MTDLTTKTGTVSSVYAEWIAEKNGKGSSKYEQIARVSLSDANKAVIDNLRQFEGHGISSAQIAKQTQKLNNCRKPADALFIMAQAMLTGAGLSARI